MSDLWAYAGLGAAVTLVGWALTIAAEGWVARRRQRVPACPVDVVVPFRKRRGGQHAERVRAHRHCQGA